MERSSKQLHDDIFSMRYNFEKSKSLAPIGYKFSTNHDMTTDGKYIECLEWYKSKGCVILPQAYNMYDEIMENFVGVYSKINSKGE